MRRKRMHTLQATKITTVLLVLGTLGHYGATGTRARLLYQGRR
jgi:hypothetical protein